MSGYLPPRRRTWTLAYLDVPATWAGGARRVLCRVDYGDGRVTWRPDRGSYTTVWCEITGRTDAHLPHGQAAYMPESLISQRGVR